MLFSRPTIPLSTLLLAAHLIVAQDAATTTTDSTSSSSSSSASDITSVAQGGEIDDFVAAVEHVYNDVRLSRLGADLDVPADENAHVDAVAVPENAEEGYLVVDPAEGTEDQVSRRSNKNGEFDHYWPSFVSPSSHKRSAAEDKKDNNDVDTEQISTNEHGKTRRDVADVNDHEPSDGDDDDDEVLSKRAGPVTTTTTTTTTTTSLSTPAHRTGPCTRCGTYVAKRDEETSRSATATQTQGGPMLGKRADDDKTTTAATPTTRRRFRLATPGVEGHYIIEKRDESNGAVDVISGSGSSNGKVRRDPRAEDLAIEADAALADAILGKIHF